ncbi:RagB/SusD family nutrient uptake outer membrane protein [Pedobacter sp. KBW06]|uniref:RagB/SusD family nutrient uptake outer membrane protein n=1 Tax=Pedobacter sp. KBW06 TaxID=2153359 RepID=UPI000F5B12FA|nr:RagB/SusD family nutrient uptake outer membrane protein [Pedobacter sp. KBW06]RQO67594.1 RagB/SusD family nutrient uptake outer membrane protein [Pedobacter sp. KBW06]
MMVSRKIYLALFCGLVFGSAGCQKFLDAKPEKTLTIPSTLADFQALLDNYPIFAPDPHEGEHSDDDHYLNNDDWESLYSDYERKIYTWEKEYQFDSEANSWSNTYRTIYFCNTVLEGLQKINRNPKNSAEWDHLKGQALYYRGKRLLQASFIWTPAYDKGTANSDLGLPLRFSADFNIKSKRASVEETYLQLLNDLKSSIQLLPINPVSKVRPSKPACYALLSRAYLSMRDYVNAGLYADSCLQLNHELIDYNDLDGTEINPLKRFNTEVIAENEIGEGQALNFTRGRVSPDLYNMYDQDDLRKEMLFSNNPDGTHGFRARLVGTTGLFGGTATNEVYLNRAESYARAGKTTLALNDLNKLLLKRWRKNKFNPISGLDAKEVLDLILKERRKELLFRGIRWVDLKRLNKEGRNIVLTRNLNNKIYRLEPNDLRYTLLIPQDVITRSGMQQNPR